MAVSEGAPCRRHACDRPPSLRVSPEVLTGPKRRAVRFPRGGALAIAFLGLALPVAAAEDFIVTEGMLSDDDFYRLVACGAEPGGDCTKPMLHWKTERPLRVALEYMDPAFLGGRQARARAPDTATTRAGPNPPAARGQTDSSAWFLRGSPEPDSMPCHKGAASPTPPGTRPPWPATRARHSGGHSALKVRGRLPGADGAVIMCRLRRQRTCEWISPPCENSGTWL